MVELSDRVHINRLISIIHIYAHFTYRGKFHKNFHRHTYRIMCIAHSHVAHDTIAHLNGIRSTIQRSVCDSHFPTFFPLFRRKSQFFWQRNTRFCIRSCVCEFLRSGAFLKERFDPLGKTDAIFPAVLQLVHPYEWESDNCRTKTLCLFYSLYVWRKKVASCVDRGINFRLNPLMMCENDFR